MRPQLFPHRAELFSFSSTSEIKTFAFESFRKCDFSLKPEASGITELVVVFNSRNNFLKVGSGKIVFIVVNQSILGGYLMAATNNERLLGRYFCEIYRYQACNLWLVIQGSGPLSSVWFSRYLVAAIFNQLALGRQLLSSQRLLVCVRAAII